jgi:hypothetical protein
MDIRRGRTFYVDGKKYNLTFTQLVMIFNDYRAGMNKAGINVTSWHCTWGQFEALVRVCAELDLYISMPKSFNMNNNHTRNTYCPENRMQIARQTGRIVLTTQSKFRDEVFTKSKIRITASNPAAWHNKVEPEFRYKLNTHYSFLELVGTYNHYLTKKRAKTLIPTLKKKSVTLKRFYELAERCFDLNLLVDGIGNRQSIPTRHT